MKFRLPLLMAALLPLLTAQAPATVLYVDLNSPNPTPPYTNWITAATNIQDAITVGAAGDLVLVTNGVYRTGGRVVYGALTNRVAVTKPLTVQSVNGPAVSVIQGYQVPGTTNGDSAVRCVYLTNGAVLAGFCLTNGATRADGDDLTAWRGGGLWCESTSALVSNCVLVGNSAADYGGGTYSGTLQSCSLHENVARAGGGAYDSTLGNCALWGNSAAQGGGAELGTLNNCTLTGNRVFIQGSGSGAGGGAFGSTLRNCILYDNISPGELANYYDGYGGSLNFCCTTPLPAGGYGNITNEPVFVDPAGGDFRLQINSPCINAGDNVYATGAADLDGNPRISAGTVDIGAYEFQNPFPPNPFPLTRYVDLNSTNPTPPYTNWFTAATNIQDAIDVAVSGDQVLVTNGVYQVGGRVVGGILSNRVVVTKPLTVQSASGPGVTIIQGNPAIGDSAVRCAYLANGAVLAGFTLTQGGTRLYEQEPEPRESSGGGVWCDLPSTVVSNCVLTGNSAYTSGGGALGGTLINCILGTNSADHGGGAMSSVLIGCTLVANSAGGDGGGAHSSTLTGCTLVLNTVGGDGGGAYDSVLTDCTLSGNTAPNWGNWYGGALGGGAYSSTLSNCTLTGNSAYWGGGGAYSSTLDNCTLAANSTDSYGGGASACTLTSCMFTNNSAWSGGGATGSTLDRCNCTGNTANFGAGAGDSTLRACLLTANAAKYSGGGANNSTLTNCTLTGNSAGSAGGGTADSTLVNCIVYYNSASAGPNYSAGTVDYCCTVPLPAAGVGNIVGEPQLADLAHLSAGSPCRGAGSATDTSGLDIDGEAWASQPSIGCDEYYGTATGALSVAISAPLTNVIVGLALDFTAQVSGHALASRWEFGDGTGLSNRPYASHSWAALGDYAVVLRAYNDSYPAGLSATVIVHVVTQAVYYVALGNASPAAPYTSWATAATNIQDAVDAATTAGALVLVSNGVYSTGARLVQNEVPHRLVVAKPLTVQSVNGPAATVIQGQPNDSAIRCAYLAGGASLAGFTLTNGNTMGGETWPENRRAGGVWCDSPGALISNCVIVACSADEAGGVYSGTLNNCTLVNNSSSTGGGAYLSTLNNCLLLTNSASSGGGAWSSTLDHCFLTGNGAGNGGAAGLSTLHNCTLTANVASAGGAASQCTLSNCAVTGNAASDIGGGACASVLYNCTVTGNAATNSGGGISVCTNFNSLVYYNVATSGSNWAASTFNYCCTLPLPAGGLGNIATEPQLADACHLSASSLCLGAGSAGYAAGLDIDDEAWFTPPAIGCDEYHTGGITGPLSVSIQTPYTSVAAGYDLGLQAVFSGHAGACRWDFGDGTVVSNRPYASHAWTGPGDYAVELRAYNETYPAGVSASITVHVQEPIHYVMLDNPAPVSPYLSWATAATNIQDAVDAAFVGGTIIVSNGVYQTGGRVGSSLCSNRVSVTWQLTLASVNGPASTVITGAQPSGSNALRCVSLVRGCVLAGFTLTGGGTRTDGDGDLDQSGAGVWCDSTSVLISNCVITGNSAAGGAGGVLRGTLRYCVISTNSPGGAAGGVLDHCTVAGNSSGGAGGCVLTSCLIEGNSAYDAGGVGGCTLTNCTIRGNHAARYGGGSEASTMYSCLVIYNTAGYGGGGLYNDWAYNCTIVGNSAGSYGGGVLIGSDLANCILVNNTAPNGANYYSDYLNYCCTTPYYSGGAGNLTDLPMFVDSAAGNFRLQANSPCVNTGDNSYASTGTDLDGDPRIVGGTVDMGAYEFPSVVPLQAGIQAAYTNTVPGYPVSFTGLVIGGRPSVSVWDFGDGTIISNTLALAHSWAAFGDYPVVLRLYNETYPDGVSATVTVHVAPQVICHVDAHGTNPVAPYTTWATAATNIQDAADLAPFWATAYVLVTNGTYQTGGRVVYGSLTNRLVVPSGALVRSVNGPSVTVIQGNPVLDDSAVRCVFLSSNATLSGFGLTLGATRTGGDYALEQSGGGAWCQAASSVLSNCVLFANTSGNSAGGVNGGTLYSCILKSNTAPTFGGYAGASWASVLNNCALIGNSSPYCGGAAYSTLNNCLLSGNSAGTTGGGVAIYAVLNNCTLVGNSAGGTGGGADSCTLNNCIVYSNTAPSGPNYSSSTLNYCCTVPLPGGTGNLTNLPAFVDSTGGNLRLQSNSPCIDAGTSAYVVGATDLDGRPRIVSGRVDIGAYEFQGADVNAFISWLQQYGLPTDASSDYADADGDHLNNWQEWRAGTNPTNAQSALRLVSVTRTNSQTTVTWQSVGNRTYALERSCNLGAQSGFLTLVTNIAGHANTTSYTDMNAVSSGLACYRVAIQSADYQVQSARSIIPFTWLQQYGLPTDGSADFADTDNDGRNNWQEWMAGTDPRNLLSVLKMLAPSKSTSGVTVSWQSVSGKTYYLQRGTNLLLPQGLAPLQSNIVGQAGMTSFTDATATNASPYFYRVGVQQ